VLLQGLPGVDRNGLSDPYVKLFISPAPKKHVVFKTVIHRHTVNPQFDQNFVFQNLTPDCLEKKSIVYVALFLCVCVCVVFVSECRFISAWVMECIMLYPLFALFCWL
jgi:hypothetical protein